MINKPKGCNDIYGIDAKKWKYIDNIIDAMMERYNYDYIRTPIFESSQLFHRGVGQTTDVVTKETYDFIDRGNRQMTLRPEGTAGVVRSYIENKMYGNNQITKLYYNGTMYRYERPQLGRDREFTQFGVEVFGSNHEMTDAEVISIPYILFKILGLPNIKVKINSLGDTESRNNYHDALVNYFKPHIDNLCEDCKARFEKNPLRILDCKIDKDSDILKNAPTTLEYLNEESKTRFEKVQEYLSALDIDYEIDPKIVRGLDYYNHTVFEVEYTNAQGQVSTLAGGGRYNSLVETLGGPSIPAFGFATGTGRILNALENEKIHLPIKEAIDVYIMAVSDTERNYAMTLAQNLRLHDFIVDYDITSSGLKSQFKKADNLSARYLIILNDENLRNDQVMIKNNQTKEEELVDIDYIEYFLEENLQDFSYEDLNNHECNCDDETCTCDGTCHCHEEK